MENIQPGAMPWLHRYVGNPMLIGLPQPASSGPASATPTAACARCAATCCRASTCAPTGMEFASEMVIRAAREHLDIRELPIEYHPRGGKSKLSPFRDGWRHLRLMLVYSPTFLFLVPGVVMFAVGSIITLLVFLEVPVFGRNLLVHTLIVGSLLIVVGAQAIGLGLCARAYGVYFIGEQDRSSSACGPAPTRARAGAWRCSCSRRGWRSSAIVVGKLGRERLRHARGRNGSRSWPSP